MSKFLKPQSGYVYHCINVPPEGDHIRPSTGYGGIFNEQYQKNYGFTQEKPPLIFASAFFTKALAFGLRNELNEKICNQGIEGSNNELVVICDRDQTMAMERDITVYKLPDTNFQILQERERQHISTQPMPFNKAEVALKARNVKDLMQAGLQVLSFKETFKELMTNGRLDQIEAQKTHEDFYVLMSALVKKGVVSWENKDCKLNPDNCLAKKLNIPTDAFRHKNPKKVIKPSL